MNLAAAVALRKPLRPLIKPIWASGTSEGAVKGWDTRGRGRKEESRKFTLPNGRVIDVSYDRATQDAQLAKIRQEEMAKLPQHVQDALAEGKTTVDIYKRGNLYVPERAALHDAIMKRYLDGHMTQSNPQLEIVAGGAASGKSKASAEVKSRLSDFVYVNTDDVRAALPEFGAFVGGDKMGALQDEAGEVRDQILNNACNLGLNIVLDAPGSKGIVDFANRAENEHGYTVSVNYVHRDVKSAQASALDRKYGADELPDLRDVPTNITLGSHVKARGALEQLSKDRALRVYDNQGDRSMVYYRDGSGKVRVYNGDRLGVIANGQGDEVPKINEKTFSQ